MGNRGLAALFAVLLASHAHAQDASQSVSTPMQSTAESVACCTLPAGTAVALEIADPLSSASAKRGDKFAIVLAAPLSIDDTLVVPAGTTGVGEVVHAERARGGGKPGEMLLAARYLELEGKRIPLRGMKLGAVGADRTNGVLAASFALGPFAQFIRGGEIELPKGAAANAILAEAFVSTLTTPTDPIPASPTLPTPAAGVATPASTTVSTTDVSKE